MCGCAISDYIGQEQKQLSPQGVYTKIWVQSLSTLYDHIMLVPTQENVVHGLGTDVKCGLLRLRGVLAWIPSFL